MAARYGMDPRAFRDMPADDFAYIRHIYDCGFERRQLAVKSVSGAMAVVEVGG
jgi:hypothetical protein